MQHNVCSKRAAGDYRDDDNEDVAAVAHAAEAEEEELQEAIRQSLADGGQPSTGAANFVQSH